MRTSRLDQLRLLGYVVDEYHDDDAGVHVAAVRGFDVATMIQLDDVDADAAVASLANADAQVERVRQQAEAIAAGDASLDGTVTL